MGSETDKKEKVTLESDYSLRDVAKILGISYSCAFGKTFYGEYRFGSKRRIRKDVFEGRRTNGLSVTVD